MKIFILLFLCLLIAKAGLAHTGMIVGLEAPLLQYPNIKSKVLQMKRKGEKLYIAPDPRIPLSPLKITYNVEQFGKRIVYDFDKDIEFYHTLTKNGTDAYIPVSDVKLIHSDSREFEKPIISSQNDPRDYRLEEPLPRYYPFSKEKHKRISLNFIKSSTTTNHYSYEDIIISEKFKGQKGLKLTWGKKAYFDTTDRFYFGGIFNYKAHTNLFSLSSNLTSSEKRRELSLGPYATYDSMRTSRYMITFGVGMTFNYHLNLVGIKNTQDLSSESRQFSGYSIAGHVSGQFVIKNIIPETGTDFKIGIDGSLYSPYNLKTTTKQENNQLWSQNDYISSPISSNVSITLGFMARY